MYELRRGPLLVGRLTTIVHAWFLAVCLVEGVVAHLDRPWSSDCLAKDRRVLLALYPAILHALSIVSTIGEPTLVADQNMPTFDGR